MSTTNTPRREPLPEDQRRTRLRRRLALPVRPIIAIDITALGDVQMAAEEGADTCYGTRQNTRRAQPATDNRVFAGVLPKNALLCCVVIRVVQCCTTHRF